MRVGVILLVFFLSHSVWGQQDGIKIKADNLKKKVFRKVNTDTLKVTTDTIKLKIARLDSIRKAVNPDNTGTAKSISENQDSIGSRIGDSLQAVTTQADTLSQKLNRVSDGIRTRIGDKASDVSSKDINLPASEIHTPSVPNSDFTETIPEGTINVPDAKGVLPTGRVAVSALDNMTKDQPQPTVVVPHLDEKVPELNADIPNVEKVKEVTGMQNKIPSLRDSTGKLDFSQLKKIQGSEKVQEVTDQVDEVSVLKDEAVQYKEQLKDTKIEDVNAERIEQEAIRIEEVKEIDAQTQKLKVLEAQQAALLQRYSDKKLIQAEMRRKTANVVNNQLTKFYPAIKDAQSNMTKTKKVYESSNVMPDSVKRKKRINTMAGKPFQKRIVPGLTFQTYSGNQEVLIDLSPQIGYRLTGWLTAGVAGVYRIGMGKANPSFVAGEGTYGCRVYADYGLVRGIFIHADFESLEVKNEFVTQESKNVNVLGSYFGLGKQYSISRNIRGSVLALYRINYSGNIPGQSKFTLRAGFDYVFKKKRKLSVPRSGSL